MGIKKLLAVLLPALVLLASGCSDSKSEKTDEGSAPASVTESSQEESSTVPSQSSGYSYLIEDAKKPVPSSGTAEDPLSLGEWGTAAKYCTSKAGYVDVPVRIVSVRRGDQAAKEVKDALSKGTGRYFGEPEKDEEVLIAEYEICLDDFPVKEGGTLCDVTAFLSGPDGEAIKLKSGSYWSTTMISLDEDTYYFEGTVHSALACKIKKEVTDFRLVLGEYGETQVYYKGK